MKAILVTGGSGFLGVALVRQLVKEGYDPRVLDINEPKEPELEKDIEYVKGDIRDPEVLARVCRGVDTVFHLAAAVLPTAARRPTRLRTRAGRGTC